MLNKGTIFSSHSQRPCIRGLFNRYLPVYLFLFFTFAYHYSIGQTANFTIEPVNGNFCAPSPIKFQATFSETPSSFYWQFGIDGRESDAAIPIFTYSRGGNFVVTLTVLFANKLIEVKKNLSIFSLPAVKVLPNRSFICQPGDINFGVTSSIALTGINWNFGDGVNASSTGTSGLTHSYTAFDNYIIRIDATDVNGCKSYDTTNVMVAKPTAILEDSVPIGCIPINVNFLANVTIPTGTTVSNYSWNFGDGTPVISSSVNSIQHNYTSSNSFRPNLTITTSEGCTNTFNFPRVEVGDKPGPVAISVLDDTICASEPGYFTASSSNANGFIWEIQGKAPINSPGNDFSYKFDRLGLSKVKVTPVNYGCSGSSDSLNILIRGVIANFRFDNTCVNKSRFNFRSNGTGTPSNYRWFFTKTDSLSGPTINRPSFQFSPVGSFLVTFIADQVSTGCSDTLSTTIYTAQPKLVSDDSVVCRGAIVSLILAEVYEKPRPFYTWQLAGKNINNRVNEVKDTVLTYGVFTNRVIIDNGRGYCNDTLYQSHNLRVVGPKANMEFDTLICFNDSLMITDLSSSFFPYDEIKSWFWSYGNNISNDSPAPPNYRYPQPGSYDISLNIEDEHGCIDSISKAIKVNRLPIIDIISADSVVCLGKSTTLTAIHNTSLLWAPASLVSCDTCAVVTIQPNQLTVFTCSVTDSSGCENSRTVTVDVWNDFIIDSTVLQDTSICIGQSVPFDIQISDKVILWAPAASLSATQISNPVATPVVNTVYTVNITDSTGCFTKSLSAAVEVNPLPDIVMGPDLYIQYNTPFTIKPTYSSSIVSHNWQPASLLSCSNCPEPSGVALGTNIFNVITTTNKGCIDSASIIVSIECTEDNIMMPNAFTPNNDGLNDFFYPITKGEPKVTRFIIYNRMGEVVFQRYNFEPNDRGQGWDGTFKGKAQPSGSFIFMLETECYQGASTSKRGSFMLLR